jgi:hypothetical protein
MYVLQLAQQVIAERSSKVVSFALNMLESEFEQFMEAHGVVIR